MLIVLTQRKQIVYTDAQHAQQDYVQACWQVSLGLSTRKLPVFIIRDRRIHHL